MDSNQLLNDSIIILDYGSQYTQLIARRIRELHVHSTIVKNDISAKRIRELKPKGIILSGGPNSVYDQQSAKCDQDIFELDIPILGICYGMQLISHHYKSTISKSDNREFGRANCFIDTNSNLFKSIIPWYRRILTNSKILVWMSHGDQVKDLGSDLQTIASTADCINAAICHNTKPIYGIQFHPEVSHTEYGLQILSNFVDICKCRKNWNLQDYESNIIDQIREQVGSSNIICGLSGGVDSAVVAAILHKALGKQLHCILIDNGLLRKNEARTISQHFQQHFQNESQLRVVDASEQFLNGLEDVSDPQQKRKIIGELFIRAFEQATNEIDNVQFLAQGTLYPDIIESGAAIDGPAAIIKSHHNVGGLPDDLRLQLIEPLRDLFKDEVRALGKQLGLPEAIINRHPFPGPGLAVRCLSPITQTNLDIIRQADAILLEQLNINNLYHLIDQAFTVLLPVKSVGVMGDNRTYEQTICIRCVNTQDFMTADWSKIDYNILAKISSQIINQVNGVNRVVYDISSKPPATIEWE